MKAHPPKVGTKESSLPPAKRLSFIAAVDVVTAEMPGYHIEREKK
jgi:hypothetical protein